MPSLFTITPVQLFVGALLFVSLLYGQRDLAVLTLLVLGVIGGARLWARFSLTGVRSRLMLNRALAFPGEQVTLRVNVENAKLLPIWLEARVPIGSESAQPAGENMLSQSGSLLWYERTQFHWELTAGRRGVYQIGPLDLRAGDLFSFFSRRARAVDSISLVVYPRLVPLQALAIPRRDFFGVPTTASPVQDPIYILGTRDYQHGHPSKYIHWKASARHNRLQGKVFEPSVQEKVLLVVNVESFAEHQAGEGFERVLEVVASLAVRLERQGHAVGLVANGTVAGSGPAIVPVARNIEQVGVILETLARLDMTTDGDLRDLLRSRAAAAWGISCVYFSYQADETVVSAQEYLMARKTPALFFVCQSQLPEGEEGAKIQARIHALDEIRLQGAESG